MTAFWHALAAALSPEVVCLYHYAVKAAREDTLPGLARALPSAPVRL